MTKSKSAYIKPPPTSLTSYRGPISPNLAAAQPATTVVNIASTVTQASDAVGELFTKYTTSGLTSLSEWASWSDTYTEYRILGMEFYWEPLRTPSYPGSTTPPVGVIAVRNGASLATPVTVAELMNVSLHKKWNLGKPIKMTWRMNGIDQSGYIPVSTPADYGGFFIASGGGTPTTNIGRVYITYLVQFLGRK